MFDLVSSVGIAVTAAAFVSSLTTLRSKPKNEGAGSNESVTIVIRKPDGTETRIENVPLGTVAAIEKGSGS